MSDRLIKGDRLKRFHLIQVRLYNAWEPNLYEGREGKGRPNVRESGKYLLLQSGIRKILINMESGILGFGIRNPTKDWNPESNFHEQILESSTWNPESTEWNPESKTVLDSFTWGEKENTGGAGLKKNTTFIVIFINNSYFN